MGYKVEEINFMKIKIEGALFKYSKLSDMSEVSEQKPCPKHLAYT